MKNRRAKVVYSYVPQNEDELRLEVDEVIEVLDEIEEGWWKGISPKGVTGVFPSNFVAEMTSESPQINKKDLSDKSDSDSIDGSKSNLNESLEKKPKPITKVGFGDIFAGGIKPKLSPIGDTSLDRNKNPPKKPPPPTPASDTEVAPKLPPKPVREQAKVLFAYEAQNEDELTIKEGDIINIITKEIEDVGWWKGELNGRIALFPDNFVEILKPSEEPNTTARVKKPERPTEKPPPALNASQLSKTSIVSKPESTKSPNKPFEELPKSSVGSNSTSGVSSAPIIPVKKPKVLNSSLFQSKPKQESTPIPVPSSVKPDVVPQENGSKHEKDIESNGKTINSSETNLTPMDSTGNKLTHLTAMRPKGPSSRRPPSTIYIPKEPNSEPKENGDLTVVSHKNDSNSSEQMKTSLTSISQPPPEKVEKLPPWMVELRKAQEKRKENPEEPSKVALNSPTKTSPNRFSGDFSNKSLQQSSPEEKPLFKPKPTQTQLNSAVTCITSTVTETPTTISTNSSSNKTTNIVISSATTTATIAPTPKLEDTVVNHTVVNHLSADKKEVTELKDELRALRDSTVSRKDFEELVKQVTELKEVLETQKQSYSKIIKDLINDVSDEKKKLATLQIEVDRLRKLTTTV